MAIDLYLTLWNRRAILCWENELPKQDKVWRKRKIMIITISGPPGAGKTTTGKKLAKELGYKFYSMGDLRGRMALERGMSIEELNKIGEESDWTDRAVDVYQRELGEKEDNFIVDGNLGFHFIPRSLKIFLMAKPLTAAERTLRDKRKGIRSDEKLTNNIDDEVQLMKKRLESNKRRYKKYYNVDFLNKANFDIIIDTTDIPLEQVVRTILLQIERISADHKRGS